MNVQEKDKIMQTARMVKSVRDSMNIILTEATVDDYDYLLPYSEMLNEFRSTFLNVDMMVINELNDLFMNLW